MHIMSTRKVRRSDSWRMTALFVVLSAAHAAHGGGMRITEWMYAGSSAVGGEFIEFTNLSDRPIDLTGWSFDDDHRVPGAFDLSAFGVVEPGESVIVTEDPAEYFRTSWDLAPEIQIIGDLGNPIGNNLGRNDEINLYDADGALIDRLTYGDQSFPGTIRTRWLSGVPAFATAIGANDPSLWQLSAAGDAFGAWTSADGDVGSPGIYVPPDGDPKPPVLPELRINEFQASNSSTLADEDGDFEDWIEIHYTGKAPLNLSDYGLSDSAGNPFKWTFPDIEMQPGDFLIVFASGKDRAGPVLHTNFSISAAGEPLLITHHDGTSIDFIAPIPVPTDISYGRRIDDPLQFAFFDVPTPGAANTTAAYDEILAPPHYSHDSGFYAEPLTLTVTSSDPGAVIRFTADGSPPTDKSALFRGPVSLVDRSPTANDISMIPGSPPQGWLEPSGLVRKAHTIRVRAFKPGALPSSVLTRTYFVGEDLIDRYTLPVISLTTDRENLFDYVKGIHVPGLIYDANFDPNLTWWFHPANYRERGIEWERPMHMELFEEGMPVFAADLGVRIHGGISRAFRRKSLRLYARGGYGPSEVTYPLFGDDSQPYYKRFLLRNGGNDYQRTIFRDAVNQKLVRDVGVMHQSYRPTITFINGEYWGILNLRDRIDKYFVASRTGVDPEAIDLLTGPSGSIVEGDRDHFLQLLALITGSDLTVPGALEPVEAMMDIDSFITYFALQIYIRNTDWPQNNIDFWRPRTSDGRWQWILYDTDISTGTHNPADAWEHNSLARVVIDLQTQSTVIIRRLLTNPQFRTRFINRYADLMNTVYVPARVIALIDQERDVLLPEMPEHIARWRGPAAVQNWQNLVQHMRDYYNNRPPYARAHVAEVFGLDGPVAITFDNPDPQRGSFTVSTVDPAAEGLPWTGTYFIGVPVPITAAPEEGFRFAGFMELAPTFGNAVTITPGGLSTLTARFVPRADLSGDGVVDSADLLLLLSSWGRCPADDDCPADLTGDGVVNSSDLLLLLSAWGST